MAVFVTERTARKPHRCGRCRRLIAVGERYAEWRMSPDDEVNDGRAWRRGRDHLGAGCPAPGA